MGIIVRNGISYSNGSKINDNVVDQTTTWSSQKIKNEFDEVKIFKTPNATIHGNPTISNGQITGFSSTDYLAMPFSFNFNQKSFELRMAFTTGEDVNTIQNIFGSSYCIAAFIQTGKLNFKVSSDGVSWDLINYTSTFDIRPNTTYYVNFGFTGIDYKVSYSLNGTEYIDDASIRGALWPHNGQVYIGVDIDFNNPFKDIINFNNPFKGIINFNKWEIKVGGAIFWEGMDDLGLATRLGTDLDNIDEEGIKKIREFAAEEIAQFSPMTFRGTLGEGGTITELGEAKLANKGYTYKVITDGTYQDIEAHKGDLFISNGVKWVLVPSGSAEAGSIIVEITKAEYEELTDEEREGIVYFIKDWDMPGGIEVDSELSSSSENPVQNKVVKTEIDKKENSTNKVTSLSSSSTDTQYPSAKAVFTEIKDLQDNKADKPEWSDVAGIRMNFENKTFTRLAGAVGLSHGTDFNKFPTYAEMRRCNLSDEGVVNAYYGDADFKEDGSNGQVMVEIPKFYYKVVPLKLDRITDGKGFHLRKAEYYISQRPIEGFKIHPAFTITGEEHDYIYIGAYEGCLYDVSVSDYITDDIQVMDVNNDKLSSIINVKPVSGLTQNLTRDASETLAKNRGSIWHSDNIFVDSVVQMLLMIETGGNSQKTIGRGIVDKGDGTNNESENTGATSSLGNNSGTTSNGAVSYRGIENFWGNIWTWSEGINIWGDGKLKGGIPYIATTSTFVKDTKTNYESAGFTLTNASGYIKAFGYNKAKYDWLFLPSEIGGNENDATCGDYTWTTRNLSDFRVALLGGRWNDGSRAGSFCWYLNYGSSNRYRDSGARISAL